MGTPPSASPGSLSEPERSDEFPLTHSESRDPSSQRWPSSCPEAAYVQDFAHHPRRSSRQTPAKHRTKPWQGGCTTPRQRNSEVARHTPRLGPPQVLRPSEPRRT